MKIFISLALILGFAASMAQEPARPMPLGKDISTGKYASSGIVYLDSIPADILMEGTYKWLMEVKYVNSAASKGVDIDEAVFNRIRVSQYFIGSKEAYNTKIRFIITIDFKDGRFRYVFTDFSYLATTARTEFEEVTTKEDIEKVRKFLKEGNVYIEDWVNELTAYLKAYKPDDSW